MAAPPEDMLIDSENNSTGVSEDIHEPPCDNINLEHSQEDYTQTEEDNWDYSDLNSEELKQVKEHIIFHEEHLKYFRNLEEKLKTTFIGDVSSYHKEAMKKLPKHPKQMNLSTRQKVKKPQLGKELTKLTGIELLNELEKHLMNIEVHEYKTIPDFKPDESDVKSIENILCEGEKCLKQNNSCSLLDVVKYGMWLNRLSEINFGGFQKFVKEKLKYSPSWIRKVRQMTKLFTKFKKLQNLDIFVTEAISITPALKKAFALYPTLKNSWK